MSASKLPTNIPINQISWPCTHNAFNSEAEIGAGSHLNGGTNQNQSILAQLDDGVRALMIDVHHVQNDPVALRVRHVGAHPLPYEDLCDLLVKLRAWLDGHPSEVVMLLLEVGPNVEPQAIYSTFAGWGPARPQYYDMRGLLYTHTSGTPWPTVAELVAKNARLVAFRETDDGKGRTGPVKDQNGKLVPNGLAWYHDMWEHWLETPYSNQRDASGKYWDALQEHTYVLSPSTRGNPKTATFFNLNHFVDTQTVAAGSAGVAAGINRAAYLQARALIAWRMQARRPTLSVDFFKSLPGDVPVYDATASSDYLNALHTISGIFTTGAGERFVEPVTWTGVGPLKFTQYLGDTYLDWTIDDGAVTIGPPTSRLGAYCFPYTGAGSRTLTPKCPGYVFTPSSITWSGASSTTQNFTVTPDGRRVASGQTYLLGCVSEGQTVHLSAAEDEYARTSEANAKLHTIVRVDGPGDVVSDDLVYIQSTESRLAGHYLRKGSGDLWYEGGPNPNDDHRWRVVKIGGGDRFVRHGDQVWLRRPNDGNDYMSAKGVDDYVNITNDGTPQWFFEP